MKGLMLLSSLNLAVAVAIGAFGAHALKDTIGESGTQLFHTATQYHLAHGVGALVALSLMGLVAKPQLAKWCVLLLLVGSLLFAGSLYALAITQVKVLGAITPFGGVCFIAGWICLGLSGWRESQ